MRDQRRREETDELKDFFQEKTVDEICVGGEWTWRSVVMLAQSRRAGHVEPALSLRLGAVGLACLGW